MHGRSSERYPKEMSGLPLNNWMRSKQEDILEDKQMMDDNGELGDREI